MKIEILHPIEHDGKRFERGVVEVGEEIGKLFVALKNAAAPGGVAKEVKSAVETLVEDMVHAVSGAPPAPAAAKKK